MLGGVALALAMHSSLVFEFGDSVPNDLADPLAQAWQVAWGGHALLTQPLDYFQSNQFWPGRNTLAYSDALAGYAPAGMVGSGPHAAVVRYDALFLFSFVLCFAATYLLARELGLEPLPAIVAGIAFAYAPYRIEQYNHLHILSSGGVPLALFLLIAGHRRRRAAVVVAGWAVVAWQLTLGWSLGLLLVYLLAAIAAVLLVGWWRAGRPRPARRLAIAHVAGLVLLAGVTLVLSRPYLAVQDALPEARRTLAEVALFSGNQWSYFATAEESTLWGSLTAPARDRLTFPSEQMLFLGVTVVVLALVGLLWRRSPFSRPLRVGLAVGVLVCMVLALGASDSGVRRFAPYRLLYELAPGFKAVRVPGRISTLTTLGVALLAGSGAQRLYLTVCRTRGRGAAAAATAVVAAIVLLEGSSLRTADDDPTAYRTPKVPAAPAGFSDVPTPVLYLPADPDANRRYLLWSTGGFPAMANGRSSNSPRRFAALVHDMEAFPDPASAEAARSYGVRAVVLDRARLAGTPWAGWARRSTERLDISREVRSGLVVYRLR